ncbi:hypothetical protein WQ56_03830 [Luteimonas sp. FCS-9]|nr:hypothetical protein WQ56_03830 [Luteimonas sp. FCS-9]
MLAVAEADAAAGRNEAALIGFADAGKADPTRKDPWVRIAQIEFNNENYARAIVAAEEVLQRDGDDLVADGILTVSGFRIANQSLLRLQRRGALGSNTARREAEALAGTLRATMGADILQEEAPPPERETRRRGSSGAAPRRPAAAQPAARPAQPEPAPARPASSDPFQRIGGN